MKNLPLRIKMISIYLTVSVFTFALLFFEMYYAGRLGGMQDYTANQLGAEIAWTEDARDALHALDGQRFEAFTYMDHADTRDGALAAIDEGLVALDAGLKAFPEDDRNLTGDHANRAQLALDAQEGYARYAAGMQSFKANVLSRDIPAALQDMEAMKQESAVILAALDGISESARGGASALAAQGARETGTRNWSYIGYLVVYFIVIFTCGRSIATMVAKPLQVMEAKARDIANGEVDVDFEIDRRDEIGLLEVQMKRMVEGMREQRVILGQIAAGDYTGDIELRSEDDAINSAIRHILETNNEIMSEIYTSADQVSRGASQIAQGAQNLANASSEQASSIEEFSATIGSVSAQTQETSETAQKAMEISVTTSRRMEESLESMREMVRAMSDIDESSANITKVIKTIDDIAFQTNILALNAAVEAARAGQHGKGFAVVADEVGNLSKKSSEAAKETAELIEGSARRVQEGNRILERTSGQLSDVDGLARENRELMAKLSEDAERQYASVSELREGIGQISNAVQANTATAEESASSAEEMSAQSSTLNDIVARFRIRGAKEIAPQEGAEARRQLTESEPQPTEFGGLGKY